MTKPRTVTAWLEVVRVEKGNVKRGDVLPVEWVDLEPGSYYPGLAVLPGYFADESRMPYYPGEEVKTGLVWRADKRVYNSTLGYVKTVIRTPPSQRLPRAPGQSIGAAFPDPQTGFDPAQHLGRGLLGWGDLLVFVLVVGWLAFMVAFMVWLIVSLFRTRGQP
jgi:hypothetical protein